MDQQIKIALVDDESLFLDGLSLLLASNRRIKVVVKSERGDEFLEYLATSPTDDFPEIVLLDICMKPMDGFELVEKLNKLYNNLHLIILSSHYQHAMLGHMIRLGVSAFLPKHASRDLLVEAIETVHKTGVFFTMKDHEMLTSFVKNQSPKRHFNSVDQLTERELEVLRLICAECTNAEIAEKLFISKRTVESHRQRILEKIGAKNTAGLVIYAICHEIFAPGSNKFF